MQPTGVVIDSRYQDHLTGGTHPESPRRVESILAWIEEQAGRFVLLPPREARVDELALVHDGHHVERVAASAHQEWSRFDADTPACRRSYDTARLAAGGLLALVDGILAGAVRQGMACVRPPGHHAERDEAMGFCLFNNVAIAAQYLRVRHGVDRVLVVDWDLHHGNGTQHIFESDPGVLYVSLHQYPFYPGTGAMQEVGRGDGAGFTVNVPLPAGCGDAEYLDAFDRIVVPVTEQFAPDFILVSAGFDAHGRDPLGDMQVTTAGFRAMTRRLQCLAESHGRGRLAAVLEGGYDLSALVGSTAAVLDEMGGASLPLAEPLGASRVKDLLAAVADCQRPFWRF